MPPCHSTMHATYHCAKIHRPTPLYPTHPGAFACSAIAMQFAKRQVVFWLLLSLAHFVSSGCLQTRVRYFRNPYGTPRPTEPQNPPATKKEIPKTPKTPIIAKSRRSFPKSRRPFPKSRRPVPKSRRSFPKVNVKYF